ncbi:MAG: hypothetical protein LQ341_001040 [Variospora aurantia]|nr:MAG: hypothetical protein LQ341_001040 [Variospora aurantia]
MSKQIAPRTSDEPQNSKRRISTAAGNESPRKKAKHLLAEDSATQSDDASSGGASLHSKAVDDILTINQDFARKFEHNKRREELLKLEEKYGPSTGDTDGTDSSSDSEDEDDEGILASGDLEKQVQATLTAIRAKDPRVYDHRTAFYTSIEDDNNGLPHSSTGMLQEKPMFLSDYHRRNILEGVTAVDQSEQLPTYTEEQNDIKATIIQEIHAGTNGKRSGGHFGGNSTDSEHEAEGDFLVPKTPKDTRLEQRLKIEAQTLIPDVEGAEKDPEKFLSDFMTARAWVPQPGSRFQPFESDDDEEEQRADEFEEAYNLRFDDPSASNEKLVSHARDTAARYSVRREALTGRKKSRETESAKREVERLEREEEKARLRKLRIAEAEEKMKKIKDAAGLKNELLDIDKWSKILEAGWDDKQWDEEMSKKFGETYYADHDADEYKGVAERKLKIKKPKWKDDIDIQDLIPDFEKKAQSIDPLFYLSDIDKDDKATTDASADDAYTAEPTTAGKYSRKKQKLREQKHLQKQARNERRQIEQLVDKSINIDSKIADMGPKHRSTFRYRETSPIAYGLTPQDILLASDSQLNQYAGLKKLAAFRDSAKKAKDHKRLGKKARLRQWRKETFGNEQGPQQTLADVLASQGTEGGKAAAPNASNVVEGTRRKKRPQSKAPVTK